MANKYVFNRDSITVNGRTFPAQYTVMTGDCLSVELLVEVGGGELARISVPPSDRQYKAALQAAQMGLTLDAATAPDGGSTAAAAAPEAVQADGGGSTTAPEAVQADGGGSASRDGDSVPGGDVPGPEAVTIAAETTAPATAAAPEAVDNIPAAAAALEPVVYTTSIIDSRCFADADPANVETVNPAGVDADPAGVETVQAATAAETEAAAPEAATINNEEVKPMNKRNNAAAEAVKAAAATEAVKAAAAAEVQEMTAAEADPKAPRGPVPEKTFKNEVIAGKGWSIVFDAGCNRTRVIIAEPVKAAARPIVEEAGFYYSKTLDSWNKKLTFRAYRAAQSLAEKLRAALA